MALKWLIATAVAIFAAEFLADTRIAVTGVSRNPANHGGNVVYQRLREGGYEVFRRRPQRRQCRGRRCYADPRFIPGGWTRS